jgi:hypothetical protein
MSFIPGKYICYCFPVHEWSSNSAVLCISPCEQFADRYIEEIYEFTTTKLLSGLTLVILYCGGAADPHHLISAVVREHQKLSFMN